MEIATAIIPPHHGSTRSQLNGLDLLNTSTLVANICQWLAAYLKLQKKKVYLKHCACYYCSLKQAKSKTVWHCELWPIARENTRNNFSSTKAIKARPGSAQPPRSQPQPLSRGLKQGGSFAPPHHRSTPICITHLLMRAPPHTPQPRRHRCEREAGDLQQQVWTYGSL